MRLSLQVVYYFSMMCKISLYNLHKLLTQARYRLYGEWEKDDEGTPMVLSAKQTAKVYFQIPSMRLLLLFAKY